jgi:hypothetical protein
MFLLRTQFNEKFVFNSEMSLFYGNFVRMKLKIGVKLCSIYHNCSKCEGCKDKKSCLGQLQLGSNLGDHENTQVRIFLPGRDTN